VKLPRRTFLHLAAGAGALPAVSRIGWAQTYPTRPVRLIVGFPPGSTSDIVARLVGQWLSERLRQPFIVDNRPGASGNIATEAVAHALPDGYTLLLVGSNHAINATLYQNLNFHFIRDIAPIGSVMRTPGVMEVNPEVPAKSVPEFITYAKANAGMVNMASGGNGTVTHLAGELFKIMAGVDIVHVPYRGSPAALTGLLGGQVQVMFDNVPTSLEFIRLGRLRPLAMTTATQLAALPNIPPLGQFLSGYEASLWQGIGAPKNTSPEIVSMLNKEINLALTDPETTAKLAGLGGTPLGGSPVDFGTLIVEDAEKWGKVIKLTGIKAE
jgi:tripartite-type tricarboxylate transporter receptor subunit TctC